MTPSVPSDAHRLARVMSCVLEVMASGEWLTLPQIVRECAARGVSTTESSVSARLRQARNDLGREVTLRAIRRGFYAYRIAPLAKPGEQLRLGGVA